MLENACALQEELCENSRLQAISLDSLSFIELLVNVENEFGIEFEPEELLIERWNTVRDLVKITEMKYGKK